MLLPLVRHRYHYTLYVCANNDDANDDANNYDANAAAKNFIEITGQAWQNKVVGFLCAAGGEKSYMSIMSIANSLMLDFRCVIIPRFVYVSDDTVADEAVVERIHELADELVRFTTNLNSS